MQIGLTNRVSAATSGLFRVAIILQITIDAVSGIAMTTVTQTKTMPTVCETSSQGRMMMCATMHFRSAIVGDFRMSSLFHLIKLKLFENLNFEWGTN